MQIGIDKYEKLGTPDEICYVLKNILSTEFMYISDIFQYCSHNLPFFHIPIEAIISFFSLIEIVSLKGDKIALNKLGEEFINESNRDNLQLCNLIMHRTLSCLKDGILSDFLDFKKIKFDMKIGIYTFNNSIPIKYSGLRNLLINMGFFRINHLNDNILIFDNKFSDNVKELVKESRKRLSIQEFKKALELQEIYGFEAEQFVMRYEFKRLNCMINEEKIIHISQFDVTAGYDILSFETEYSIENDRFIEVKSFNKKVGFYWSKNELEVAKIKRNDYYLYLIDRDKYHDINYQPLIINNPYEFVFMNDAWFKDSQNWYICQI